MAPTSRLFPRMLAAMLLVLLSCAAFADPPGRVARLADLQNQVWLFSPEAGDWVAAARNRPLTTGDRLATGGNARAELRIGSSTLHVDGGSELEVLQLDDDAVRLQLRSGSIAVRLRSNELAREFELVTEEGRFRPERAGRYRFDRPDGATNVSVWSGQLLFEAPDNAATFITGQSAEIFRNPRTQYTLVEMRRDAFADEVAARDRADERSVSTQYVSPEMTGVEDLDRYGRWQNDPEYGALWEPRDVEPDWAPYRFGQWAWVAPWGWTWVDNARWGFAPFHYGRWVQVRNRWCWSPGQFVPRPVYAPALVAWVGGPRVNVSVSIGGPPAVGWFPLGPREVFVPGYRTSPTYVRNVNITHVTNITNVTNIIQNPNGVMQQTRYRNRDVPGAVTIVPASVVSERQPVGPARLHAPDAGSARSVGGGAPVDMAATVTAAAPVAPPVRRQPGSDARGGRDGGPVGPRPATPPPTPVTAAPALATVQPPAAQLPPRGQPSTSGQLPAMGAAPVEPTGRAQPQPGRMPVTPPPVATALQTAPVVAPQPAHAAPPNPGPPRGPGAERSGTPPPVPAAKPAVEAQQPVGPQRTIGQPIPLRQAQNVAPPAPAPTPAPQGAPAAVPAVPKAAAPEPKANEPKAEARERDERGNNKGVPRAER